MSEWKSYLNDRLIKDCGEFFIIKPVEERDGVPISCPVCSYMMRTYDDEKSYRNFGCCESCETHWARPNLQKWKEGWRPEQKQVDEKFQGRKKITVHVRF